jgi:hypothetical protein
VLKYLLLFSFTYTLFSASHCWEIKNEDRRHLCEVKFEHQKRCWQIKSSDMRAYCEATAEGQRSCWKIKEHDLKAMCEAEVASNS